MKQEVEPVYGAPIRNVKADRTLNRTGNREFQKSPIGAVGVGDNRGWDRSVGFANILDRNWFD